MKKNKSKSLVWICLGLGTDSIAMLVEMVLRGERIDLITFADTGAELPLTYSMIKPVNKFLKAHKYPQITIVKYHSKTRGHETLEQSIVRNSNLPSLAFGFHTCSVRFKIEPQIKFAKTFQPFVDAWARGEKVIRCIGYDFSPADSKRANRSTANFPDMEQFENRYPLREWEWTRKECLERILSVGLPDPKKSSCYFCPARKIAEVLELAEQHPEYFEKALSIERSAIESGKLKKTIGLGRNWSWASVLNGNAA